MSNVYTCTVNLGKDPEELTLSERQLMKLRCAEKGIGKKATTRWFTALVGGLDAETAKRLRKGDSILLTGSLIRTEFKAKKPRYQGEMLVEDEMPFAKIMQVLKSPSFFDAPPDAPEAQPDDDVSPAGSPATDPLAGLD